MDADGPNGRTRTRILYLAPWVDYGGSDKGTIDWFRWLDRERFEPSLICTQPSDNRRLAEVERYAREVWALPDLMPADAFPRFIFDFIDTRGVELLHVMNARLAFELLPDLACMPRPPRVVVQLHVEEQTRDGYVRLVTTRYGNLVDAFSVTSEHLAAAVEEYDVPRERIVVIPTGVDADEEFSPERVAPLELDEREEAVEILYPGRLCDQKDPLLMVEVAAALRDVEPGFRIHVVGDGELEDAVRERVRALGLERHVRFHPPTREIARWYAASDLLLMTSVFEGVPYVVYESMAMALPVVAPALPGNVELLGAGDPGLVPRRDDVAAYVERLRPLVADRTRRTAAGAALRARVKERFSLAEMAHAHERLYERLLRERPLPPALPAPPPLPPALRFRTRPVRDRPLVSVIVPCFNHGRFLRDCLASIAAQTYPAIETIVVDDCSTDPHTRAVLDQVAADGGVQVLRQPRNAGPSAARNRAIAAARGRYVLPVDADNLLVEDAVEQLVRQLQQAGEGIGFVYPNLQFFGNRDDYYEPPQHDPHRLLLGNYCDTSSLFDREIFDAGLRFDEEIRLGHEDWDFALTLAERGIGGERAHGRTLLYRKHGFSRADAVDHAQEAFGDRVRVHHPALYGHGPDRHPFVSSKARAAPELSFVALAPLVAPPDMLQRQSCWDFELIAFADGELPRPQRGPAVVRIPAALAPDSAARLELGAQHAKGRIVVAGDVGLLRDPSFVEKAIRLLDADGGRSAIAFAEGADGGRAWRPLRADEPLAAGPHAFAWRRSCAPVFARPLHIAPGDEALSLAHAFAAGGGVADWRNLRCADASSRPLGPARPVRLDRPRERARRRVFDEVPIPCEPALPRMTGSIRRWTYSASWLPPLVSLLCRHREIGGERRLVTNAWASPPGFELEYPLGCVRNLPYRGTARLLVRESQDGAQRAFEAEPVGAGPSDPPADAVSLGHLELAHFPLLNAVVLARHPATGEEILVGGPEDALFGAVEPLRTLGFVEPFPIEPRVPGDGTRAFGLRGLVRAVSHAERRHRYGIGALPDGTPAGELGALIEAPQPGTEPVWLTDDGVLLTDGYRPRMRAPDPLRAARWAGAPLRWRGPWSPAVRARSAGRRTLVGATALLSRGARPAEVPPAAPPLGYLWREPAPERVPLYAGIHPITHDQLLTTQSREATDLGYEDVTLIGHLVATAPETGRLGPIAVSVPWGSRFGAEAARR